MRCAINAANFEHHRSRLTRYRDLRLIELVVVCPSGAIDCVNALWTTYATEIDVEEPTAVRSVSNVSAPRTSCQRPRLRRNVPIRCVRRKPAETSPAISAGSPVSAKSSCDGRDPSSAARELFRQRAGGTAPARPHALVRARHESEPVERY